MQVLPKPPFHWAAAQHVDPRYGYAWYCGAGLIASHITVTHGTEAAADAYDDFESTVLRDYAAEVAKQGAST